MNQPLSSCCGAPMNVEGLDGETRYYGCTKCEKASDPKPEAEGWKPTEGEISPDGKAKVVFATDAERRQTYDYKMGCCESLEYVLKHAHK